MKCQICKQPMQVQRKTKKYCSTRCRTIAFHIKSVSDNAIYPDAITPDEAVGILNWHWWNERDKMLTWSGIDMLNALFQKMDVNVITKSDGSFAI